MRRYIKNAAIYCIARLTLGLLGWVPTRYTTSVGTCIGNLAFHIASSERRIAIDQITHALQASPRRATLVARGVFVHLAISIIELCRLMRNINNAPPVHIPAASKKALDSALAQHRGVIFVTGHIGNWELMAITLARAGYPISTTVRPSYDSRFTRYLDTRRRRHGVHSVLVGQKTDTAGILRALRTERILGFLIDQDTRVPSVAVPFFHRVASTPKGAAAIAHRTDTPIVLGAIRRHRNGCHHIDIRPISPGDTLTDTTAALTRHIERIIRHRVHQWVWFHRRWKTNTRPT